MDERYRFTPPCVARTSVRFLTMLILTGLSFTGAMSGFVGCTPHVVVEAPDKPIEININAKISHEVKIKVEKDVEDLVNDNKKKLF